MTIRSIFQTNHLASIQHEKMSLIIGSSFEIQNIVNKVYLYNGAMLDSPADIEREVANIGWDSRCGYKIQYNECDKGNGSQEIYTLTLTVIL